MSTTDLRLLGVIPCRRCQDTGLARDGAGMDFCDCPVGAGVHQAALDRALGALS